MKKEFWEKKWLEKETPWDTAGVNPALELLLKHVGSFGYLKNHEKIYVPGCGQGHDANHLAHLGYHVYAVDFVAEAIHLAKKHYSNTKNVSFEVKDVFTVSVDEEESFDVCYDRAMLVALDESMRKKYIDSIAKRLKKDGLFISIMFSKSSKKPSDRPPYPLSDAQMFDLLNKDFSLVFLKNLSETNKTCLGSLELEESLHIWKKRS